MKPAWTTFLGWVLAVVLICAGGTKALDPAALAESIAGFRLVPWPMAGVRFTCLGWSWSSESACQCRAGARTRRGWPH